MTVRTYQIKSGKHYRREKGLMVCYKAGDFIKLNEFEAEHIMDKLVLRVTPAPLVDPDAPGTSPKVDIPLTGVKLTLQRVGNDKYNVVNPATKRAVNEELLTKEQAEALIEKD